LLYFAAVHTQLGDCVKVRNFPLTWVELWGFEPQTSCMPCAIGQSQQICQSPAGSHLTARIALMPSEAVRPHLNTLAPGAGSSERARLAIAFGVERTIDGPSETCVAAISKRMDRHSGFKTVPGTP
jgi:hypothetical protein